LVHQWQVKHQVHVPSIEKFASANSQGGLPVGNKHSRMCLTG